MSPIDRPKNEMRNEYDFSAGIRGKYAPRYAKGSNVVVLEPDVAAEFKTSESVNAALRDQLRSVPLATPDYGNHRSMQRTPDAALAGAADAAVRYTAWF